MLGDAQYASRGSGTSDEAERALGVDRARANDRSFGVQGSQVPGVFIVYEIPWRT